MFIGLIKLRLSAAVVFHVLSWRSDASYKRENRNQTFIISPSRANYSFKCIPPNNYIISSDTDFISKIGLL